MGLTKVSDDVETGHVATLFLGRHYLAIGHESADAEDIVGPRQGPAVEQVGMAAAGAVAEGREEGVELLCHVDVGDQGMPAQEGVLGSFGQGPRLVEEGLLAIRPHPDIGLQHFRPGHRQGGDQDLVGTQACNPGKNRRDQDMDKNDNRLAHRSDLRFMAHRLDRKWLMIGVPGGYI